MAEVLVKFDEPIAAPGGKLYFAQAVGLEVEGGLWQGWLEFQVAGSGSDAVVSGRETTQPNRTNLVYWAQGLTRVYLEGALSRAIDLAEPVEISLPADPEPSLFDGPRDRNRAPGSAPEAPRPHAILDPFQVYGQGEEILRSELNALSPDHVTVIAIANRIGDPTGSTARSSSKADLIETIVAEARERQFRTRPNSADSRPDL